MDLLIIKKNVYIFRNTQPRFQFIVMNRRNTGLKSVHAEFLAFYVWSSLVASFLLLLFLKDFHHKLYKYYNESQRVQQR